MRQFLGFSLLVATACGLAQGAPLAVHLHSTLPSPQPVGTPIGFVPRLENAEKAMHVFRYSVSVNGGPFRVVRDFSQALSFAWTPDLYEQEATVRVTARNNDTKATAEDQAKFRIVPRVKGGTAIVTPTAHPLVALFSAPPCADGTKFRVAFQAEGEDAVSRTPPQPCRSSMSNNVYVAGMRAETTYRMRAELAGGSSATPGAWLSFRTGMLDGSLSPVVVTLPRAAGAAAIHPILIYGPVSLDGGRKPFATDLNGRVVWYMPSTDSLTRVLPGGRFLLLGEGMNSANTIRQEQLLLERDLVGNVLHETNASRLAEQLEPYGIHSDCKAGGKECLSGIHHEAVRLPNGHTLVIAGLERMMPAGTQGAKEAVDVLGDVVLDLDEEFQVSGAWNEFDHLDLKRSSVFSAKCKTGGGGCPPVLLAPEANGWTHSNSLNYIPSSGDLLVSIPEQNWVVKVDWKNGKGSGKILWRLGKDGDFKVESNDPSPWFSYAHDVGFEPEGSNILSISDDSHERHTADPKKQTRVQVWKLDEEKKVAVLAYNAEVGGYSICCGSAQELKNGGYHSVAGWVDMSSPHGLSVETDKDGKVVHTIELEGAILYRSFRVDDMYSNTVK